MIRTAASSNNRCSLSKACIFAAFIFLAAFANGADPTLELSRPVRPWEFLSVVGTRAGLFGNESGQFEVWVYPLKIVREFHLRFHVDGKVLPAETLARTITVRPESTTIVYSGDTFSVRETFLVPVNEPGVVINFEIETAEPLEIEAAFQRDFQLEWPASIGGTYQSWNDNLHAFSLGEESGKFVALVGSPSATEVHERYSTNYSTSEENCFRLRIAHKGRETRTIIIAASHQGANRAESVYLHLTDNFNNLTQSSAQYYRTYLSETVNLELPDAKLQQAYDWSKVSMIQGLVTNPFLGTGLVAGYNKSGSGQRPGFAWFFGRDALWTSLALNAAGDFKTTRSALDFLSRYQRSDGKVPHEISQGATFTPWFTDSPYAYASADATPLFIIAMDDYVEQSGDVAFAQEKWGNLWKAYEFLRSTYDSHGNPQNFGIGHGWIEGGPLYPVKTELYQCGLGVQALKALANLAQRTGKTSVAQELNQDFVQQKSRLSETFWSPDMLSFVFALDKDDRRVDELSVLATVPMWYRLLDEDKVGKTLEHLADSDHQADWGMRILSSKSSKYNPGGYHFGTVWPLFTGWASVGQYRYHRSLAAYSNLRANALLALDGSPGHVTEVLSGDYYQPVATGSPHQIWSAAMVVNPLLRGLFGLQVDAASHHLTFAPHIPADWTTFTVANVSVGPNKLKFHYRRSQGELALEITNEGTSSGIVEFSPSLSLRAKVTRVDMNGRPITFHMEHGDVDQHLKMNFPVTPGVNHLRVRMRNDFGLSLPFSLPALGAPGQALRILSESWTANHNSLQVKVAGVPGVRYEFDVLNASQIESIDGAELVNDAAGATKVLFRIPTASSNAYLHSQFTLHFWKNQQAQSQTSHP